MFKLPSILTQSVSYNIGKREGIYTASACVADGYPDLSENIPFIQEKGAHNDSNALKSDGRALVIPTNGKEFLYKGVGAAPSILEGLYDTRFAVTNTLHPRDPFNRYGIGVVSLTEALREQAGAIFLKKREVVTPPIVGIYKLLSIPTPYGDSSIKNLQSNGRMPYIGTPVVLVRHQKTNIRLGHLLEVFTHDNNCLKVLKDEVLPPDITVYFSQFIHRFITDFIPLMMEGYQVSTVSGDAGGISIMNNLTIYGEIVDVARFALPFFDIAKPLDQYISFLYDEWNKICVMMFFYAKILGFNIGIFHTFIEKSLQDAFKNIRIEVLAGKVENKFILSQKSTLIDDFLHNKWLKK